MIQRIKDIWEYRDMINSLARRDLRGKYKKSVLGFLWSFITPLCQIVVYTVLFTYIFDSRIPNFYIYLMTGLIPWTFFNDALSQGSGSVVTAAEMTKKIYFPREVLPLANVLANFINMLLSFLVVFFFILISGVGIDIRLLLFLPVIMILELIFVAGITILLAGITVYLRDMEYIIKVVLMALIWMTPVMYEVGAIPENLYHIVKLNPMMHIIMVYHDILFYHSVPEINLLLLILAESIIVLLIGEVVFARLEGNFAEEL